MTATEAPAPPKALPPRLESPRIEGAKSQGPRAIAWIEASLVHGEGDFHGQPFRFRPWQKYYVTRLYEHHPDRPGARRWKRSLLGLGKGNGKTELAAAIALYETFGADPVFSRGTADVPIGAASYEQADLLFGAARIMASHENSRLSNLIEAYDTELLDASGAPGKLYRVTSAGGSNDGKRPTAFLADELHEWKERPFVVLENGLAKRDNSLGLYITTAGVKDSGTVCESLFLVAEAGSDPDLLVMWWAADPDLDLNDPSELTLAIRQANPAAGDFFPIENLLSKWASHQIREHDFRRYHLNQWTASADDPWLPTGTWGGLDRVATPPADTRVRPLFDGAYNNDSAALVGATVPLDEGDPSTVFVVRTWDPLQLPGGTVPHAEVDVQVAQAMRFRSVRHFGVDPTGFYREADEWADQYGDDVVLEIPGGQVKRWSAWSSRFYTAAIAGQLAHDGNAVLAAHISNAVLKETANGAYIAKERRSSARKIDAAYAAVGAHGLATEPGEDSEGISARWL